ncbi:MAG: putative ABC transporter permease [Treponema sp.]|jgi:uncharacterized membrane protein|nr:putative ABC transporter permease [Treponema sp.]
MYNVFSAGAASVVFSFFFFSASGWIGETIMESAVRRRFVSKGFFKGPWVPVHGIGAFAVYAILYPLKKYPVLVFVLGTLICTLVEYLAALLLEKVFNKKCWDYATYPFTRWCNFQKRIALTTSLFFGLVTLAVVYFYWDLCVMLIRLIGKRLLVIIDIILAAAFAVDAFFTIRRYILNRIAGIPNKTDGLL